MTHSNPVTATVDARFHLLTVLSADATSAMFLAEHGSGTPVFAKVVWEPDHFFDELARLFASESLPWFCQCLYHYAPPRSSGQAAPFNRHPGEAFEVLRPHDIDQLGVLILEPVAGVPLEAWCKRADDLAKIDPLLDVTEAIEALHKLGEVYGDMAPNRIWIEEGTEEIKILDMGPGCPPGPDFNPRPDVEAFADLGLRMMKRPNRRLKRHLKFGDGKRSLMDLRFELQRFRKAIQPRRSLEVWIGFMRPLHIATWFILVVGVSVMISRLQGEPQPLQQRRDAILDSRMASLDKVQALRSLLAEAGEPSFRQGLIRDIGAALEDAGQITFMPIEDRVRPIAVLDLSRKPVIIGRESIYHLGDLVRTDTGVGRIDDIEYNRFLWTRDEESQWLSFERPRFYTGQLYRNETALIWNNDHNLPRLLEALASLEGQSFENQNTDTEGKLAGTFTVTSSAELIEELTTILDLRRDGNQLVLSPYDVDLPVYVWLFNVNFQDKHIDEFKDWLTWVVGYPVEYDSALKDRSVDLRAYNTSWRDLLTSLGFDYEVINQPSGQKVLRLKEGSPPRAPSLN